MTKGARTKTLKTIADLTPDAKNANVGTARGRAMVEASVRRYGFGRSILADKHGRVIAGNKTLAAGRAMEEPDVVVVKTSGKELVVVQRTDLDLEKDAEAMELAVADNRANEVGLAWGGPNLKELEAQGADMRQFWRDPEWEKLVVPAGQVLAKPIPEMEIQPFEHHDYLMVVFKDVHAWTKACDLLGIKQESVTVGGRQKIGVGRVITAERLFAALERREKTNGHKRLRPRVPQPSPVEHYLGAKSPLLP